MDKYEIAIELIKKRFTVGNLLYLIDGKDKNPLYLIWDTATDKYIIVTYYNKTLQTVFQIKSTGDLDEIWRMLVYVISAYEKHNK